MNMLKFFEKKAFNGCKSQIFVIGYRIDGRELGNGQPVKRSMRLGDDFDWLGDHSANQEALEVSLRGSWMLCTPSLLEVN